MVLKDLWLFFPQSLPTVLASNCETIWFPRLTNLKKPHLTGSLWLYCGSLGMKVWLPVFPRDGRQGHNFMSRRIMLHFPMYKLYPLGKSQSSSIMTSILRKVLIALGLAAILFEDAIILGAEGDSLMIHAKKMMSSSVPYSTLERTVSNLNLKAWFHSNWKDLCEVHLDLLSEFAVPSSHSTAVDQEKSWLSRLGDCSNVHEPSLFPAQSWASLARGSGGRGHFHWTNSRRSSPIHCGVYPRVSSVPQDSW